LGRKSKKLKAVLRDYGPDALDIVANVTAGALGANSAQSIQSFAALPLVAGSGLNTIKQEIEDGVKMVKGTPIIPNPLMLQNGHDGESPLTDRYVYHRWMKNVGGGAFSMVGYAASTVTAVNTTGIARHAAADASTAIHIYKLNAIGNGFGQSTTVSDWLKVFIKMKAFKAAIRTGNLASDATPVAIASAVFGVASSLGAMAVKKSMEEVCMITAMQVHWRAYQETAVAGSLGGGTGPATRIFEEMLTRRIHRFLGGSYDVRGIIKEPAGWVVLNDKLMLI